MSGARSRLKRGETSPPWSAPILAAIAALVLAAPFSSHAQGRTEFVPKKCSTCPTMTNVPWDYRIGVVGTELPRDPNCAGSPSNPCPHYINWTTHSRYITGNGYIKTVGLNFASFKTEPVHDTFSFGEAGGAMTTLSGTLAPGWHDATVSGSLQTTPMVSVFHADDSNSYSGLQVEGARICCSETETSGVIDLEPHIRYTGFLIGTGDAVFYRIPTVDETTHTTIAMWAYPHPDPDPFKTVDVYVKCNQLPTRSHWDYYGGRHSQQEFLHIPSGDTPASCDGHWYIAVYSRGNAHTFNLVAARHLASRHRKLTAGFQYAIPPATELPQFVNALSDAAKYYFGATEGTQYFDEIELYTTGISCRDVDICDGKRCDVCFYDEDGRSSAGPCSPVIPVMMRKPTWLRPQVISHELTHKFLCLGDEYDRETGCARCGHSIMAKTTSTLHNLCYAHTTGSRENHFKDPAPGCLPSTAPPAWQEIFSRGFTPWKPSETPDNYNYQDFDFAGKVGSVVVY